MPTIGRSFAFPNRRDPRIRRNWTRSQSLAGAKNRRRIPIQLFQVLEPDERQFVVVTMMTALPELKG
jgi:hypothetical protein